MSLKIVCCFGICHFKPNIQTTSSHTLSVGIIGHLLCGHSFFEFYSLECGPVWITGIEGGSGHFLRTYAVLVNCCWHYLSLLPQFGFWRECTHRSWVILNPEFVLYIFSQYFRFINIKFLKKIDFKIIPNWYMLFWTWGYDSGHNFMKIIAKQNAICEYCI